ncbi:MAG TPA: TolC family protein [Flavisolibacter sp.]
MKFLHLVKNTPLTVTSKFALLGFLLAFMVRVNAQNINSGFGDTSSAIEERLVQLAWQGPEVQKTAHQIKIDEYQLRAAQNVWMNLLAFNINYNEFTFNNTQTSTYVYPRYNLGITIPLGTIFSRTAVKSAKENIEIGKDNTELIKRTLREQVLTAYKQYLAYGQLIAIQSALVNDVKTQAAQVEEKFRSGSISLDLYTNAQKNNNVETAALVNLKLQQDIKKLELEKLIGVKLESVLKK